MNVVDEQDDAEVNVDNRDDGNQNLANDDGEEDNIGGYGRRKRKKTSKVWNDFKEVPSLNKDGSMQVACNHCHALLVKPKTGTTTTFQRHLQSCGKYKRSLAKGQQLLTVSTSTPGTENSESGGHISLKGWKFDQAKVREVLSHMIMVHELPFLFAEYELFNLLMKTTYPEFRGISRFTLKNDCMTSYEIEKKRTANLLKNASRVSITTDIWKSEHQKIEYMVVTCHLTSDFKLHKRVLSFVNVPPPHKGEAVCDALYKCLEEWGIENKLATITADNAAYNDTALKLLKENLKMHRTLPYCGGILFQVRCCAHILNLLVKDGMDEIETFIHNVRESVKYITASTRRTSIFSEIAKQLHCSSKKLKLDCSTRWNATYDMLSCALEFKNVFPRYQLRDETYKTLPSEEDFEKAEKICKFLQPFSIVTNIISGSLYPTANLFLPELKCIKELLDNELNGDDVYMSSVAKKMKAKFDKYWGECNLLISIAAALDPRMKMKGVEIIFKSLYSKGDAAVQTATVRAQLFSLYQE